MVHISAHFPGIYLIFVLIDLFPVQLDIQSEQLFSRTDRWVPLLHTSGAPNEQVLKNAPKTLQHVP